MNMNQMSERFRILAVSLSSRGFGYAVMEGNDRLIYFGKKIFTGEKNAKSLTQIDKLIIRSQPNVLALHDVKAEGTRRDPRIKALHRRVVALGKKHKIKVVKISGIELRTALLGNPKGTKHEMAELLAKQFPDELASRLPPKRRFYDSEDARMDIFDAGGLVTIARTKSNAI
jgi:hypothetical protein